MKLTVTTIGNVPMQPSTLVSRERMLDNIGFAGGQLSFATQALAALDRTEASVFMIYMRLVRHIWPDIDEIASDEARLVTAQALTALKHAAPACPVVQRLCDRTAKAYALNVTCARA